eukprot:TRINITY_DN4128_c0_g5_i1.p1 TRINITY_DN4128_c0_g5~~TRINITY_DN4128_c0_g5_i1.p1  ORF type:complete len:100 (-),score=9.79 TRINITY_DN4128_c0_g5_i1:727-1026(-)
MTYLEKERRKFRRELWFCGCKNQIKECRGPKHLKKKKRTERARSISPVLFKQQKEEKRRGKKEGSRGSKNFDILKNDAIELDYVFFFFSLLRFLLFYLC